MAIRKKPTTTTATNKHQQEVLKLGKLVMETPAKIEAMMSTYSTLVENLQIIKDDMSLGLDVYSIELEDKKAELEARLESKKEEIDSEIAKLEENKKSLELANKKAIEELKYTHNLDITRENEEAWKSLSSKLKKSSLTKEESDNLAKELKALTESFDTKLQEEVTSVKKEMSREQELVNLKVENDTKFLISNLEQELKQSKSLVEDYKVRVAKLESSNERIPQMIKEAVEAASKPITISTDSKK